MSVCHAETTARQYKKRLVEPFRTAEKYRDLGTCFLIDHFYTVRPRSEDSGWVNKIADFEKLQYGMDSGREIRS